MSKPFFERLKIHFAKNVLNIEKRFERKLVSKDLTKVGKDGKEHFGKRRFKNILEKKLKKMFASLKST